MRGRRGWCERSIFPNRHWRRVDGRHILGRVGALRSRDVGCRAVPPIIGNEKDEHRTILETVLSPARFLMAARAMWDWGWRWWCCWGSCTTQSFEAGRRDTDEATGHLVGVDPIALRCRHASRDGDLRRVRDVVSRWISPAIPGYPAWMGQMTFAMKPEAGGLDVSTLRA